MKTLTATELRHKFAEVLEGLKVEPVLVEKSGRPVAVVVSYQMFERMQELEDAWWGARAKEAVAEGLLTPEDTMSWIRERMNETPDH